MESLLSSILNVVTRTLHPKNYLELQFTVRVIQALTENFLVMYTERSVYVYPLGGDSLKAAFPIDEI